MKTIPFLLLVPLLLAGGAHAGDDPRLLAPMPPAAEANLRAEMRDSLRALGEVTRLLVAGQVTEAGALAEKELGMSAMGRHRGQPLDARPGAHMPEVMHAIGLEGHRTASEFARIAARGDRAAALAALPGLSAGCVACHSTYRIR